LQHGQSVAVVVSSLNDRLQLISTGADGSGFIKAGAEVCFFGVKNYSTGDGVKTSLS